MNKLVSAMLFVVLTTLMGCERGSSVPTLPVRPVSTLQLIDLGAKINVPTVKILEEMATRGLRPATDSEVRAWLQEGNQLPEKVIVIAALDRPEATGPLQSHLVPAFTRDKKTGRVVELSIQVPESTSPIQSGWSTVSYRFAAMPK